MSQLPLAIDIADVLNKAAASDQPLNIFAKAEELAASHPEAGSSSEEVAEILKTDAENHSTS